MIQAMQRQIIVLFCSLFFFAPGSAWAADNAPAQNRGALFKVQQGGHTLYLFGTIHVGAKDFYPLEPRVTGLLKNAPVLALEIDPLGDPQKMVRAMQQHGMSAKGAAELPPEWRKRLEALLKQYHIEPETVASMKPWLLASVLTVNEFSSIGYDASLAVDGYLARQAHGAGKKIVELESAESQMALFDEMTPAEELTFLEEAIAGIEDKEQETEAREIADAWRKADIKGLDALARKAEEDDSFSGRFVQKTLLDYRNPGLADGMVKLLGQENNSVAAVGVLHLVGKGSVPELLRKRGLKVERIY